MICLSAMIRGSPIVCQYLHNSLSVCSARRWLAVRILPMPRLSPSMTKGVIKQWLISEGQAVQSSQLVLEVETSELTDEAVKSSASIVHQLDVELHEDMIAAKLIGKQGMEYEVGQPIALFSDDANELKITLAAELTSVKDAYQYKNGTQMVLWQAFVNANSSTGSSCGCS